MNPAVFTPSLFAADQERRLSALLAQEDHEACLQGILGLAGAICLDPRFSGSSLYLPGLDELLQKIAGFVAGSAQARPRPASQWGVVVVASEIGLAGGHSRIVEDICRSVPDPLLVITDPVGRYARGEIALDHFTGRLPQATVMVLPEPGLLDKAKDLHQLCRSLEPRAIFVLTHHQDPVAIAGLSALPPSLAPKKLLVHHADHNPALGITDKAFVHVDCTDHLRRICSKELGRPAHLLPLATADLGPRNSRIRPQSVASTVSSGSYTKFARDGELAYAKIVTRILASVSGRHHHIGQLTEDWVNEINTALVEHNIDPGRFVYVGGVPSLWETLKTIDADLYVASAPVGGGRAAIEAQGCGYPVAYFKSTDQAFLLQIDEVYASRELSWGNVDELQRCIEIAGNGLAAYCDAAREYYLAGYSGKAFQDALARLLASDAP